MPHPRLYAQTTPDKAAYIMAKTGETVTSLDLEKRANQNAHLFRNCGLKPTDHLAIMMENHPRFFEILWGALRAGIIITPISTHLLDEEVAYILNNCEAKVFIISKKYQKVAAGCCRPMLGRWRLDLDQRGSARGTGLIARYP